jgi:hypothetical protein
MKKLFTFAALLVSLACFPGVASAGGRCCGNQGGGLLHRVTHPFNGRVVAAVQGVQTRVAVRRAMAGFGGVSVVPTPFAQPRAVLPVKAAGGCPCGGDCKCASPRSAGGAGFYVCPRVVGDACPNCGKSAAPATLPPAKK